jgi:hypothetical protein
MVANETDRGVGSVRAGDVAQRLPMRGHDRQSVCLVRYLQGSVAGYSKG